MNTGCGPPGGHMPKWASLVNRDPGKPGLPAFDVMPK